MRDLLAMQKMQRITAYKPEKDADCFDLAATHAPRHSEDRLQYIRRGYCLSSGLSFGLSGACPPTPAPAPGPMALNSLPSGKVSF